MISILIPIFNYDVTKLVASLIKQLSLIEIDYEIVCVDDASTAYCLENDTIEIYDKVVFHRLPTNIGRSKIRNLLAKKAKYDWLIFLDSDVLPKDKNFIKSYLKCIENNQEKVFCGGVIYQNDKPEKDKTLRWLYGKKREEVGLLVRQENPNQYFFGANFLIHKSVFDILKFNEILVKYGYEDVLFSEELNFKSIKIKHLENEVYHLGIELNAVFLAKTTQAIENLYFLNSKKIIKGETLKLLNAYKKIKTYHLKSAFGYLYLVFKGLFKNNLVGKRPSLFVYDLFKLTYFCYLSKRKL